MNVYARLSYCAILLFVSCKHKQQVPTYLPVKHDPIAAASRDIMMERLDLADTLSQYMINKVALDTLLMGITHQEKVKVIITLKESWDDGEKMYKYSGANYLFNLKNYGHSASPGKGESNTIFWEGNHKVDFNKYHITCTKKSSCNDYGYNCNNSLQDPKIIEVCGRKFLYANLQFACNGMGCGCVITMIYDLEYHTPTFIENYRIHYDGFFLSDFNNDNRPDLLVIDQSNERTMKGFGLDEFDIRLSAFTYGAGEFHPYTDNQYRRTYSYELYGFGDYNSEHLGRTYSVIQASWFR